jgi:hypothetical protein
MRDQSGIKMVNITAASQNRLHPQSKALALPPRETNTMKWVLLMSFTVLALIVSTFASAEENLYTKNYKAQNAYGLTSSQANPDTKMYVSNHKEDDNISMLETGYDMMGSSGFEGGDVAADLALQHGKAIKADVVLVYSKYGSAKSASSKMAMIREAAKTGKALTEKDMADEPTVYKYYASYWAKLPTPTLGVHVIKLVPKTNDPEEATEIPGLQLLAVIKDSPAAKAGLVRGDRLLKINNIEVDKPEDLTTNIRQLKGQKIDIQYLRADTEMTTQAQLN